MMRLCSVDSGLLFQRELLAVGGAAGAAGAATDTGSLDASFCTNQRVQACKLGVLVARFYTSCFSCGLQSVAACCLVLS